jgi:hypothetical protein
MHGTGEVNVVTEIDAIYAGVTHDFLSDFCPFARIEYTFK